MTRRDRTAARAVGSALVELGRQQRETAAASPFRLRCPHCAQTFLETVKLIAHRCEVASS